MMMMKMMVVSERMMFKMVVFKRMMGFEMVPQVASAAAMTAIGRNRAGKDQRDSRQQGD